MRTVLGLLSGVLMLSAGLPLLTGALLLQIGNPANNSEAQSKRAALVARTTACHAPEKTIMTASAEGVVDGHRRSIRLNLIPLSTPGTFAIVREWPSAGTWAIKVVARNPEYKDYATGALVRFDGNSADWASTRQYFHEPAEADVTAMLDVHSGLDRASLK